MGERIAVLSAKLVPWLTSTRMKDPKAKTISLAAKKGLTFPDGTDLNAKAVKGFAPENPASCFNNILGSAFLHYEIRMD